MATEPALYIVVPRWDEFQHRDMARTTIPPWIKNYTRLLSDDDYLSLTMSQRGILHGLWLMFATHRRSLNEARAKRHLCTNKAELRHWSSNLSAIVDAGFIALSASKPAGKVAGLEVEVEVEVEVEEKEQTLAAVAASNGALSERENKPTSAGTGSRSPSAPPEARTEASISAPPREPTAISPGSGGALATVYNHWCVARGKTDPRYQRISDGRRKKIQARLREFTEAELCAAIDAVARDPWPERPHHDDLTVIFRSREQVDRFLEMRNGTPNGRQRTGWRIVRGSHGSTHVRDPEGTDRAPAG